MDGKHLLWNVIFLLPPGVEVNEELFRKLLLLKGCTKRHGFWAFESDLVDSYILNFIESEHLQQEIEPIGEVVVCMQYHISISPSPNYVLKDCLFPLAFCDV